MNQTSHPQAQQDNGRMAFSGAGSENHPCAMLGEESPEFTDAETGVDEEFDEDGLDVVISQAVSALTPFFMEGASDDESRARAGAKATLIAYRAQSALEIQLAVEAIMFSSVAADSLRRVKADPNMPEARRQRILTGAVAQTRAADRCRKALANAQKPARPQPASQPMPQPASQPMLQPASDPLPPSNLVAARQPEPKPESPKSAENFKASKRIHALVGKLSGGGEFILPNSAASHQPATPPIPVSPGQRHAEELAPLR